LSAKKEATTKIGKDLWSAIPRVIDIEREPRLQVCDLRSE
jgi:hypothetical protein